MLSILGGVDTSVRVELHVQPRLWVIRLSWRPEGKTLTSLRIHLVSKRAMYTSTMSALFRGEFVYVSMTPRRIFCHKRGSIKSAHSFKASFIAVSRCAPSLCLGHILHRINRDHGFLSRDLLAAKFVFASIPISLFSSSSTI
jgi:hypothetical protein